MIATGITIEPGDPLLSGRRNVMVNASAVFARGMEVTSLFVIEEVQHHIIVFIRNAVQAGGCTPATRPPPPIEVPLIVGAAIAVGINRRVIRTNHGWDLECVANEGRYN